jgi:hypothetical protein
MRKNIAMASAAMALSLAGSHAAMADSRAYAIANWAPAMNNVDDSGCPGGRNPTAADIMTYTLKNEGMPQDQIAKETDPNKLKSDNFGKAVAMRGQVNGKAVDVYTNPLSAPDPHIKLDIAKEGFGFNLDGKTGPLDYTDPLTHESGVDNVAARVFGCFDRTRGTLEAPPGNWSYRWSHYNEGNTYLLEISNNSNRPLNLANEDKVTVTFYRAMQVPFKNGSGYQRNMTYTVDPDSRFKKNTTFKGKIRDGMFIADVTPEFTMIASPRIQPVFDFKSVHMRITFNPDGTIRGFVGGYMPINMIYFPFGDYGEAAEYIGGMDVPGVYAALVKNADTDIDADPKTHRRTRVSQTYQIDAVPAFLNRAPSSTPNHAID